MAIVFPLPTFSARFEQDKTLLSLKLHLRPGAFHFDASKLDRGACMESGAASCSAQRPWHFGHNFPGLHV